MLGRGTARHGYALLGPDGETIGVCTSGTPSPTLGKSVGLGYVPLTMAQVGNRLLVDCRGKSIEAVIVPTPFYRRARSP
jgi:aminomethyltransferase